MEDTQLERALEFVTANRDRFLDDLFELLSQPSISTTDTGIDACLRLITDVLSQYGCTSSHIIETDGHPSIIAHWHPDETSSLSRPTILMYGHYDVQPASADEWTTPPFEPVLREGPDGKPRIYARGAGDNKGQWFTHLCAILAYLETGTPPVNVTLLLEGEEESGSPNIEQVVQQASDLLAADVFYMADGPIDPSNRPHVFLGSRGMVYLQVDIRGPDRDLHSGNFGGPVPNPAWEAVHLLSSMRDTNGWVNIDGFYADVRDVTMADRGRLNEIPFDSEAVKQDLGIRKFAAGPGESYWEKLMYHPTLNVAGLTSGYGGEGKKTIIPSTAQIKIDMRLVPNQDPDTIFQQFTDHVNEHCSNAVTVDVSRLSSTAAHQTPVDSEFTEPILRGVQLGWGVEPILKPSLGASGPDDVFARALDLPCFIVPYANSDENNHSPDENLSVRCFENGVKTTVHVLDQLSKMSD
ncbi:M20/M25/M40 family metallo-hydrolase [Haloarchaeobius salinus]|uniref:M20/M25/M40 family metallo-hydrolase n=1 Tax=Haloarchaeobius salinus TaxID=1198298 RepID=UPI002108A7F8|nr:M20/M25/M40 family metallo-hydrolase [Haloarchaeobius salinus]